MDTLLGNVVTSLGKSTPDWLRLRVQRRVFDRIPKVSSLIEPDETVLDIGCARHEFDAENWDPPAGGEFLHEDLVNSAVRVVGIDIVEEAVKGMQTVGYDVRIGDAHEFTLDDEFDTVMTAEVIEHLENPGEFLQNCRDHMEQDGRILVTTPNPRRTQLLISYLLHDDPANAEHTMWFDPFVMETLASRVGLKINRRWTYSPGISPVSLACYYGDIAEPLTAGGWIFELKTDN